MNAYPELDNLKDKLDSLRPCDPQKLQAVREKFRLDWTYHSNALEGNPLTLSETSFFVREGLTSKGKPLSAYLEARNHIVALDYVESVVREQTPLTEHLIRQYHTMLFDKIDRISLGSGAEKQETPIQGGQYKQQNNHVVRLDGRLLQFADWLQVPGEMERLMAWYAANANSLHAIELAAQFHHRFVSIHPFLDGNGRVARLLMNTLLMQRGYTPAIIPVEEKKQYLEALQSADDGSYDLVHGFIEAQVSKTLRLTIDVLEGREAFDFEDLARMVQNIAQKAKEIQQDLGPAASTPEERAESTADRIKASFIKVVQEHVASTQRTPGLIVSFQENVNMGPPFVPLQQQIGSPRGNAFSFTVVGRNRTIPVLVVAFAVFSGRYQVALAASATLGTFDQNNREVLAMDPNCRTLKGSIYLEDWDTKGIHDFVLDTLKGSYQRWEGEIERRKNLIATEEARLEQYRKSKG